MSWCACSGLGEGLSCPDHPGPVSNVYQHPRFRRFTDWAWRGVTYVVATPKRIWGAVRYGGSVLI